MPSEKPETESSEAEVISAKEEEKQTQEELVTSLIMKEPVCTEDNKSMTLEGVRGKYTVSFGCSKCRSSVAIRLSFLGDTKGEDGFIRAYYTHGNEVKIDLIQIYETT